MYFGLYSSVIPIVLLTIYFSGQKLSLCQAFPGSLNKIRAILTVGKNFCQSSVLVGAKSGLFKNSDGVTLLREFVKNQAGQPPLILILFCSSNDYQHE